MNKVKKTARTKKEIKDEAIYKDFLKIRTDKKLTVVGIAKKHDVSRAHVYEVVRIFENGKDEALDRCLLESRFDCLWKFRYQKRYSAVLKTKDSESRDVILLEVFKGMREDGFSDRQIASYTKNNRSVISRILK